MSEVRLVVRDAERDWSGTIHGGCADRAVAALSADPVTMEEFEIATERFAKRMSKHGFFSNLSHGSCALPYDAGLVVIDLVARLVVADSSYSAPGPRGTVRYHDGRSCTKTDLPYHLAEDWLFSRDGANWEHVAEERRRERAATPSRNVRGVLYGRQLLEFVGRGCFTAFGRPDDYDTLKEIHAAWLLTPREDLGGFCPREVALERHQHLVWDLQDRCRQWSLMDECPRGLEESSHAFQHGGFGTHELVEYYNLVRELLWSSWEQLTRLASSTPGGQLPEFFAVGDFLTTEVPRLESVREEWLDAPDSDFHGRTPRSIISRERARLPEIASAHDAIIDPDCPCCLMMAEMPGPSFWHLDGSEMDDEFAFDTTHRTREEWEEERKEWEEYSKRCNAKRAEDQLMEVTDQQIHESGPEPIWSRSMSVDDHSGSPLGVLVFGIGSHLAELIVELRAEADRDTRNSNAQSHVHRLNRDFGNLRELLQTSDQSFAEALIAPVLSRFVESLEAVASHRPDLALRCRALTNELNELLDGPCDEPY